MQLRTQHHHQQQQQLQQQRRQQQRLRAEPQDSAAASAAEAAELENPDSEASRKRAEAERLRAAEQFMVVGTGEARCKSCGYEYLPKRGDPEYPISPGTPFQVGARRGPEGGGAGGGAGSVPVRLVGVAMGVDSEWA